MPALVFTGGGSLDGAAADVPAAVVTAVTIDRGGSVSWYARRGGEFGFIGFGEKGSAVGKILRAFSASARRDQADIDEALKPRGCGWCGGVYGTAASFQVHRDDGRCLPGDACGQLTDIDGVWFLPWADAARR